MKLINGENLSESIIVFHVIVYVVDLEGRKPLKAVAVKTYHEAVETAESYADVLEQEDCRIEIQIRRTEYRK